MQNLIVSWFRILSYKNLIFLSAPFLFQGNSLFAFAGLPIYNFAINVQVLLSVIIVILGTALAVLRQEYKIHISIGALAIIVITHLFLAIYYVENFIPHVEHTLVFVTILVCTYFSVKNMKYNLKRRYVVCAIILNFLLILMCIILSGNQLHQLVNRNYLLFGFVSYGVYLINSQSVPLKKDYFLIIILTLILSVLVESLTIFAITILMTIVLVSSTRGFYIPLTFKHLISVVVALPLVYFVFTNAYFLDKLQSYFNAIQSADLTSRDSGAQRALFIFIAFDLITEYYDYGVGLLNSRFYWSTGRFTGDVTTHLHNTPLEIFVSYGLILGLPMFIILYYPPLKTFIKKSRLDLIVSATLFVVFSLTNTVFLQFPAIFFAMYLMLKGKGYETSQKMV